MSPILPVTVVATDSNPTQPQSSDVSVVITLSLAEFLSVWCSLLFIVAILF